jgi:class 3 adenylate cyclase
VFNALLSLGQYRHELLQYKEDPTNTMAYPVFDNLGPDRKVVGVLATALFWRLLFQDVLPPSGTGIIVVIQNNFGQAETFRIDGPEVRYLGSGDLHNPKYDDAMEMFANVADNIASKADPTSRSYTAVDINSNFASYELYVYPSEDMEKKYLTWEPTIYGLVVASIFVVTAATFLMYNSLVEKRQSIVLDKAVKSTAVVRSLFPDNVQDRLYEDSSNHGKRLSNFLSSGEFGGPKGKPIADLFPDATVFFADLAGFTKWSSSRPPVDVFGLLETIYGAFDAIAVRRKVFKVETIGDCYVAVTGVPEAQQEHALIMVKFAAECMLRLRQLLVDMSDDYGRDTQDLALRIGLHSGPVTAGVLRGDRARFQLFGDTVNTAARMESNGVPGRIHCSQSTCDLLLVAGKASWLKTREGTIHAKGKGEMQTYWIEPSKSRTTATTNSTRQ